MVSVKECISNETWLRYEDNEVLIKIKCISIREGFGIDKIYLEEGQRISARFLILSTEIINQSTKDVSIPQLTLMDDGGYLFENETNNRILNNQEFSKKYCFNTNLQPELLQNLDYLFMVNKGDFLYDSLIATGDAELTIQQ